MSQVDLTGKRVLVTLPVTDDEREAFVRLVEGAGGTVAFTPADQVSEGDVRDVSIILGNVPARTLHASDTLEWLQASSAGYEHYLG